MKKSSSKPNNQKTGKDTPGQKSIKKDLLFSTTGMVFVLIILLSCLSVFSIRYSTTTALEKSMKEASELVSEKIADKIGDYTALSKILILYTSQNNPTKTRLASFEQSLESLYQVDNVTLLGGNGISLSDGADYSSREAFLQASKLGSFLTDPIVEEETITFDFAYQEKGYVVLVSLPYQIFGDIITDVAMGSTGSTYILNREGGKVAHSDIALVTQKQNSIEDAKKDSRAYKTAARLETKMIQGETGFGFYSWKGGKMFGSYCPIEGTNGWSVNVSSTSSEFMASANLTMLIILIVGILGMILSILLILKTAAAIINPVRNVVQAITQMAAGDLDIHVETTKDNEVGQIAGKINDLAVSFQAIISDVNYILGSMSEGNFNVHSQAENSYVGDFKDILTSIRKINHSLSDTLGQIRLTANQVAQGSSQMAEGAQNLAEGAAEQTTSVEKLSDAMADIRQMVDNSAETTHETNNKARRIGEEARDSTEHIHELTKAMEQINQASSQIANIIKSIEEIASQTNLLSLNASIEAARAGEAGRGFAVVANEIGQLAKQSAEAAVDTRQLIQTALTEVENGTEIAGHTAAALETMASNISEVVDDIDKVAAAADTQASAIEQINEEMHQISSVVQSNSATAEESSATSEELSAQADTLNHLISGFILKEK